MQAPAACSCRCLCRVERDGACQLVVVLYSERVAGAAVGDLLPINALRNAATLPVRTPLVALLDVDLLPSHSLLPAVNARREISCSGSYDQPYLTLLQPYPRL